MKHYKIKAIVLVANNKTTMYFDYKSDEINTKNVEEFIIKQISPLTIESYSIIENKFYGYTIGDLVKIKYLDTQFIDKIAPIKSITNNSISVENIYTKFKLDGTCTTNRFKIYLDLPTENEIKEYQEMQIKDSIISNIVYHIECGSLYNLTYNKLIEIQNILEHNK